MAVTDTLAGRGFPPLRLVRLPEAARVLLVPLWAACLALAMIAQAGATWRVGVFQTITNAQFASFGLNADDYGGRRWGLRPFTSAGENAMRSAGERPNAVVRPVRINGRDVPPEMTADEAARLIGDSNTLRVLFERRDRSYYVFAASRSAASADAVYARQVRWYSIASHALDLLVAALMVVVACILVLRQRSKPVAFALSFALLLIAATGCWRFWEWLRWDSTQVDTALNGIWLGLLLICVPAVPDGTYVPERSRWLLVAAPLATAALIVNEIAWLDTAIMLTGGLALLLAVAIRFERTVAGRQRQQVKWAVLGVAAGVLLWLPGGSIEAHFWSDLPIATRVAVFISTRLGLVILALALLCAVGGYKLDDETAAKVRSTAYVVITVLGTGIWSIGSYASAEALRHLSKIGNEPLALAIGAMVAVAVVSPLKNRASGWVEATFRAPLVALQALPGRIATWRDDDEPGFVSERALRALATAAGANTALLLRSGPEGAMETLASVGVAPGAAELAILDDTMFPLRIELNDPPAAALTLLLGWRDDSAYYSRHERAAIADAMSTILDVLRAVERRAVFNRALTEQRSLEVGAQRGPYGS